MHAWPILLSMVRAGNGATSNAMMANYQVGNHMVVGMLQENGGKPRRFKP